MLFYAPEMFGAEDDFKKFNCERLEVLYNEYTTGPYLVHPEFETFLKFLYQM